MAMHHLRIIIGSSLVFILGCSTPTHLPPHLDMAARIYTDLAQYYWQQGYLDLAQDRARLALQQSPNYQPAHDLLKQIQADID